jgi:undecaprenyl-diphosphatase
MHGAITTLLESYGYVVLFVLVGLESLGIPLPGETTLVTAAAFAATGHLSIKAVLVTAAAAAIVGDNGGYWIGRKGGLAIVRRYGRLLHVDQSQIRRAHNFFERHGAKTVFIGRFIAILRTWAAALAGVGGMSYSTFMIYNAAGGIIWTLLFGMLGYLFGRNLPRLEHYIGQASVALVLLVALLVALGLGWRWFHAESDTLATSVSRFGHRIATLRSVQDFRDRHPRAWQFAIARFARSEYLGLHLTIGLLISLAGLWLFAGITEDVIHHDPLTQVDLTLLEWFHAHATVTGLQIFKAISLLGSPITITLIGLLAALVLAVHRQWLAMTSWVATLGGSGVIDFVLKMVIRRPRPPYTLAFPYEHSFSFPSGHAMASLVGYGMLAYLLLKFWAERTRVQVVIIVSAAILIVAIGLSRLYLGVHYLSDVIGGYAAGALWLSTCITGFEISIRQRASNLHDDSKPEPSS